jgi:hypothetical protein
VRLKAVVDVAKILLMRVAGAHPSIELVPEAGDTHGPAASGPREHRSDYGNRTTWAGVSQMAE